MNNRENLYNFSPENFKDQKYEDAVKQYPKESLVYLEETGQVGGVEEVRVTADGLAIRVYGIGLVPIDELRVAKAQDIQNSKFESEDVEEKSGYLFFKK